jgi:hypothetical protein
LSRPLNDNACGSYRCPCRRVDHASGNRSTTLRRDHA